MFNLFFFCKYNDYFLNILHFNIFLCKIKDFSYFCMENNDIIT